MKILLWSDLHAHNHRPFARYDDGMNSRLRDAMRVIDQITERAEDCDASVFLGDMFHVSPAPAPVFNEVYERVRKLAAACPLLMLAGNHDLRGKYYSGDPRDIPFLKFAQFPGVRIAEVNTLGVDKIGDLNVLAFNHRREEDAAEIIRECDGADLLLMHQEIYGADNEFGYMFKGGVHPDELTKKFRWVFNGHIHKPQIIDDRVVLVGAPMHINFGDVGDRGFFILDTEEDDIEVVQTEYPRFVTVALGEEHPDDGNFYRTEQAKEKKREALKIPDWQEAIDGFCQVLKRPDMVKAGRRIANSVDKETMTPQPFTLEHIEGENYGVFEKVSYDFNSGLHMVLGEVEDKPGRSNGAGKTTLFELISWILYGRTSKGVKGSSVMKRDRKKNKACRGTIVFSSPDGELKIERTQKAKGSTLDAWFGDHHETGRVPDTQEWIVNTLGVDYDFFVQMVYFSQEQAEFFSEMGDADRKRILGTLLGTRWYESAEKEAKRLRDVADDEISTLGSFKSQKEHLRSDTLAEVESAKTLRDRWEKDRDTRLAAAKGAVEHLEEELTKASSGADEERKRIEADRDEDIARLERGRKAQLAELGDLDATVRGIQENFDNAAESSRERLREAIELRKGFGEVGGLNTRLQAVEREQEAARAEEKSLVAGRAELRAEIKGLVQKSSELNAKISRMRALEPGTTCPTCYSDITAENVGRCVKETQNEASAVGSEIASLERKMTGLDSSMDVVCARIKRLDEDRQSLVLDIKAVEGMDKKIAELETKVESFEHRKAAAVAEAKEKAKTLEMRVEKDYQNGLGNVTKRFEAQMVAFTNGRQSEVTRLKTKIEGYRDGLKDIQAESNPHVDTVARLSSKVDDLDVAIASLKEKTALLEEDRETYVFWVHGFGREGIRSALLHDFCRVFTSEVNSTLSQMGVGMTAELSPGTELKSKKGEVRDRLDYRITTDAGEMSYEELSGGEKVRVDLASMLALNLIASRHFGIEDGLFGILVLDEIFSALDEAGVEIVYQIINGFTARSMYVISHDPTFKSLFDSVVTVVKSGTGSALVA